MSRYLVILFIFFITSSSTFGQSQTQTQTKEKPIRTKSAASDKETKQKKPRATDEFAGLIVEYYNAWNTLNPAEASKYYSQDPGLIFYDLTPLQYKGWQEYQTGVSKLFQDFTAFKLIPGKDLVITRRGKVAWTTMTFHISGKQKNGVAMELDARHTAIWERSKGKWLIVHEHVSAPLPPAQAK